MDGGSFFLARNAKREPWGTEKLSLTKEASGWLKNVFQDSWGWSVRESSFPGGSSSYSEISLGTTTQTGWEFITCPTSVVKMKKKYYVQYNSDDWGFIK